jgi:hypothetical protein
MIYSGITRIAIHIRVQIKSPIPIIDFWGSIPSATTKSAGGAIIAIARHATIPRTPPIICFLDITTPPSIFPETIAIFASGVVDYIQKEIDNQISISSSLL